jgi:DNA primase
MKPMKKLKRDIQPVDYYKNVAGINSVKHTGNGWHQTDSLCPFHDDRKPGTFYINFVSGAFKCHSCGAHGGDFLCFHKEANNISYGKVMKDLKQKQEKGEI